MLLLLYLITHAHHAYLIVITAVIHLHAILAVLAFCYLKEIELALLEQFVQLALILILLHNPVNYASLNVQLAHLHHCVQDV